MVKRKYFNGKVNIEVQVTKEVSEEITKMDREYDVQRQQAKRYCMQDDCLEEIVVHESNDYNPEYLILNEIEIQEKEMLLNKLQAAIKKLTPEQQKTIRLSQEMKSADIAEYFGVSRQAVEQRIQVILKKLRKYFKRN
ncbi:MAG: hypothetical protein LBU60_06240 [Clostridiales bacterium]|nr:hypothetical protein [Clostridiales bacterium]